jgi:peptide/nickel transport system substrate-binding protein
VKGLKYISIFLIVLLTITACNSNVDIEMEEVEDEIVEEYIPADGGALVLSTTRFETLNPIFNRNEDLFQIHHLIYESLVTFSEDMSISPLLAEKWELVNGGQSIDFTLRSGVKWHDGEVLTTDDVIFTFNVIKGNIKDVSRVSIYRQSLQSITDIVKVDENTIRVNFSKNVANGLEMMTFPILPKHIFEGNKIQRLKQDDFIIVGTGKYELKEYENMRNIALIRNDNYWSNKPLSLIHI